MKSLYRILIACYLPVTVYSMDNAPERAPITADAKTILIFQTYNAAYPKLKEYNNKDLESRRNLIIILDKTDILRKQGISEEKLGAFAFKQTTSLFDGLLDQMSDATFNKGHLYLSVFFERLRQYNNNIKKNDLLSPTWEQYLAYRNNKRVNKTVDNAAKFHLHIDIDKRYATTSNSFMTIENDEKTATKEFDQLITDVWKIRSLPLRKIQDIASLLYDTHK